MLALNVCVLCPNVRLVGRVITVSIETVRLVAGLPPQVI